MDKTSIIIRNYQPSDFNDYVRLHEETEAHDGGGRFFSKQRLAEDLGHPKLHPQKNVFIAEQDGGFLGCFTVFQEPEIGRALLDGLVHPLHRKKGIATTLFNHAVRHARKAGLKSAQICIPQNSQVGYHLIKHLDLVFIRRFIVMQLDLSVRHLPDAATGNFTIRRLQAGEAQQLANIQNLSFDGSWGFSSNTAEEIDYRIHLSTCSPEDVFMVWLENDPVGYCWTRILAGEGTSAGLIKGEIHMLGVDPEYRSQGIGLNVLLAGLSHLQSKGITLVELTSDIENAAANRLYESIGFKESMILEWFEKKLSL
jgi:mycothiol synthase